MKNTPENNPEKTTEENLRENVINKFENEELKNFITDDIAEKLSRLDKNPTNEKRSHLNDMVDIAEMVQDIAPKTKGTEFEINKDEINTLQIIAISEDIGKGLSTSVANLYNLENLNPQATVGDAIQKLPPEIQKSTESNLDEIKLYIETARKESVPPNQTPISNIRETKMREFWNAHTASSIKTLEKNKKKILSKTNITPNDFQKIKTAEWQYAKRQMTWFNKDERIHWVKSKKEAEKFL